MNPRKLALDILMDVTDNGAYANLRLKSLPAQLDDTARKRVTALVYTALDHLLSIDYLLNHAAKGRQKPVIRGLLRLGICELIYMDTPAHAAVSEYVALTRAVGKGALCGYVNGVLRTVSNMKVKGFPPLPSQPVERLSIQYSYPKWLVAQWAEDYGEDFTEALLKTSIADIGVRAQYPYTTAALREALPVSAVPGALDPNCLLLSKGIDVTALPQYASGEMTVQGQSAMLACRALGCLKGKRVLDACAAPGGKSAYLASLWENDLSLTCMELHPHRKELLDNTLERLHVKAETLCHDGCVLLPSFVQAFDAVLLDAPCSGLGLTAAKPDIRYSKSPEDIDTLAKLQQQLLTTCCMYVRPGGVLLYVTCTISKRENQNNVTAFLRSHPEFCLEQMDIPVENQGMLQLFPHIHQTDGFFFARLKRWN